MTDTRLIERWLPIAALGEESVRERRSMTALPAINYLHVWWARRPLVASRAAVLASLLPADCSRSDFLLAIGIHGDPVASKRRIDTARRQGTRFEGEAYGYPRAFTHQLTDVEREFVSVELKNNGRSNPVVADPSAGGGSIPFEAACLGFDTVSNDLNPVAALILKATVEYPLKYGPPLASEFQRIAAEFVSRREERLKRFFPPEPEDNSIPTNYLWARTVTCPYCDGVVPLSPNWRLNATGTGVRVVPHRAKGPGTAGRRCTYEIVTAASAQSEATVSNGDGTCPYSDCGRVIDGDEIKRQAQAGKMGEELFAVAVKHRVKTTTKAGKVGREKLERGYRAPRPEDDNGAELLAYLADNLPLWEARDFIPSERIGDPSNYDRGHRMYGMHRWVDMFSPRQLIGHVISVEIFQDFLEDERKAGRLSPLSKAAFVYLSFSLDKLRDRNSRATRWIVQREVMANTFDSHNFAMKWSYAEMVPLTAGVGFDWAVEQTEKCIKELVELVRPEGLDIDDLVTRTRPPIPSPKVTITCKPGDALDHIADGLVDVVVMDPPYYDNVMYAELSDFFYVWLKRTAGLIEPELFTRLLTDKDNEAVANVAKFAGQKGAKALAGRDYQERMATIFHECKRILKPNGVMTLMFTHKATGAWDALTTGLMEAGFSISASWPINTEAEGSLHIKDKSAANSTIFLVCRPRELVTMEAAAGYWEDVEPLVAKAVRKRVKEFQEAGIGGVDLYLACFGPALEEFSRHWPLKRGTPRAKPEQVRRRRQAELFEEEWDPYAVTPEDALDAARREVKNWRLEQLTHMKAHTEVDPLTAWFVLAWDAFKAPVFPYDEALRLARAVGVDLDRQVVGVLAEKKASDLVLWDSAMRAAKGSLGSPDGSRAMIDAVHHAAHIARSRTLQAAKEMLTKAGVDKEPAFFSALEAVLEVLPVSKAFSGIDLEGDVASAGSDFEALENLRKLAFSKQVDAPKQLDLWKDAATA